MPHETFQEKNEVTYICPFYGPQRGVLIITNYRLFFKSYPNEKDLSSQILDVPLGLYEENVLNTYVVRLYMLLINFQALSLE